MYVLVTKAVRNKLAELDSMPMVIKVRSLTHRDKTMALRKLETMTRKPDASP